MLASAYAELIYMPRPVSNRRKMEVGHRAKQFAPFAALRGFEETVRKKEILDEPKKELSEEKKHELDSKLRILSKGMKVQAVYFVESSEFPGKGKHCSIEGMVEFFDPQIYLRIGDTEIPVSEITELSGNVFEALEQPC